MPLSGSRGPIPGDYQFSHMDTPLPDDSGVRTRALSEVPDLTSNFTRKPRTPLSGSGGPIPDDCQFSCPVLVPLPDDSRVRIRASLEIPDLANNFAERHRMPLSGSWETILGAVQFSCMDISEIPDLTSDLTREPGTPLSMSGGPIPGNFQFSCMDTPLPDDSEVRIRAFLEARISQVTILRSPEHPCSGPVDRSPAILSPCALTLCCQKVPEFVSVHPWRSRILQITLMKGPECLCPDPGS